MIFLAQLIFDCMKSSTSLLVTTNFSSTMTNFSLSKTLESSKTGRLESIMRTCLFISRQVLIESDIITFYLFNLLIKRVGVKTPLILPDSSLQGNATDLSVLKRFIASETVIDSLTHVASFIVISLIQCSCPQTLFGTRLGI